MSRYTARIVLEQINNRPVLIAPQFVRGTEGAFGGEANWGVGAVIRDLAMADADAEEAAWKRRKVELALAYSPGAGPSMDAKPFAFADGKAIIPVHGMLVNRWWTPTAIRRPTTWPLPPIRSRSRRAAVQAPSACC
jgi:hypothetical protein